MWSNFKNNPSNTVNKNFDDARSKVEQTLINLQNVI